MCVYVRVRTCTPLAKNDLKFLAPMVDAVARDLGPSREGRDDDGEDRTRLVGPHRPWVAQLKKNSQNKWYRTLDQSILPEQ